MKKHTSLTLAAFLVSLWFTAQAAVYPGNGLAGFGGAIGGGSLTLTDDGTTVYGTLTRGPGNFNDAYVIYIDSVGGGFADTSGFADANDGLRRAISGFDGSQRSLMTFMSGFSPDYAIGMGPAGTYSFGGLWGLADGGGNSLNYLNTVNLSNIGNVSAATYDFSFNLADIGNPTSFGLFGTYISDTAYRSDEFLPGNANGTQGVNPFTQTAFGVYTIPEPSTLALLCLPGLAALVHFRRRS